MVKKLFHFFWDKSLGVFLVIGGINTILSYLLSFLLARYAGWGLYASTAPVYAVLSVGSFYFNRKYSFKSQAPLGRSILRFAIIIALCFHLSFFANEFLMPWLRATLFPGIGGTAYTLVRLLGIQVVFTVLNYVLQRLWAFKE